MKKLFNFKREHGSMVTFAPQVYTATDVTADLTAKMLLFLEDIRECVEHKHNMAVQTEIKRLNRLGLSNTANAKALEKAETQIAEYNKKVDALKFMQHAWSKYGKDVMVVSYAQFMEILEKYDLVCGSLDRYTGAIPEDNLKEVDRLYNMHNKGEIDEKEALEFETVRGLAVNAINDISDIIQFARFPFHIDGIDIFDVYCQMGIKDLRTVGGLSSIKNSIYGNMFRASDVFEDKPKHKAPFNSRFFIAAPCEEMERIKFEYRITYIDREEKKSALTKFQSLTKYCELVETKDPFICSLTPYGVMIHSKWGDEAQDEIIKRYEKLSETINRNKAIE